MKTTKENIERILVIVAQERKINERVKKIESEMGKICGEYAMGSGGVGQLKYLPRLNETRIQIGYGHGDYNYAMCAVLEETP